MIKKVYEKTKEWILGLDILALLFWLCCLDSESFLPIVGMMFGLIILGAIFLCEGVFNETE